jgi:hypothetical protein
MVMGIVVCLLAVILMTAAVATTAALSGQSGIARDSQAKAALAAAEAGVSEALLRYNRIGSLAPQSCLTGTPPAASTPAVGGSAPGWCAAVSGSVAGAANGATYSYRVRPASAAIGSPPRELLVVATGTVGETTRRVAVIARDAGEMRPFSGAEAIAADFLTMHSSSRLTASRVATGGAFTRETGTTTTCTALRVGPGRTPSSPPCATSTGEAVLPAINQGDVASNNSNARLANGSDTVSGGTIAWNSAQRTLIVSAGATLTLGGGNYSLCSLELRGSSQLLATSPTAVNVYFDSPENCGQSSGIDQLLTARSSTISATSRYPGDLALLFAGSESRVSEAQLAGQSPGSSCATSTVPWQAVIYAPRTDVTIRQSERMHMCGGLAARSLRLMRGAILQIQPGLASTWRVPGTERGHYTAGRFAECSAAPAEGGAPDAGC